MHKKISGAKTFYNEFAGTCNQWVDFASNGPKTENKPKLNGND
jgi:hypothetical protein